MYGGHPGDATSPKVFGLIVHECSERGYHQGNSGGDQRRDLIGDGLARPGGQHRQDILSPQEPDHGLQLPGTPFGEPEPFPNPLQSPSDDILLRQFFVGQAQVFKVGPWVGAGNVFQAFPHVLIEADVLQMIGDLLIGVVRGGDLFESWRSRQSALDAVPIWSRSAESVVEHHCHTTVVSSADQPPDTLGETERRTRDYVVGEGVLSPAFQDLHASPDQRVGRRFEGYLLDSQNAEGVARDVDSLPE